MLATRAEVAREVGYAHAWLYVATDETATEMRLVDVAGSRGADVWSVARRLVVAGDAMLEEILRSDGPVVVADARTDPRTDKKIVEQLGSRTIVNVPMRLLDRPMGAIGTGTFGDEGCAPPTDDQLEYLIGMASQLCVAASRIRLLQERLDTEARHATVLQAALDAIVVIDHEGRIGEFNPAAEAMFGYTRAEVLGEALVDIVVPEAFRERHIRGIERHLRTGEMTRLGRRVEVTARRRDGAEFPAELAVVRMPAEGPPRFIGFIRDITERQRAQEAEALRREKEAADAANAELESFSYSVAHDLRAPLRTMSGFAGLLKEHSTGLDDDAKSYLDRIMSGASRMGVLIDAFLMLARVVRTELHRELVDLAEVATAALAQLQAADAQREVEVVIERAMPPVWGDAALLRVLMGNLLANAWKFTGRTEGARIEVGHQPGTDGVVYFVRDNGVGFDMTHVGKLFLPFERLHGPREFEGTGIGLATAARVVRRHGGRLWAEGKVDGGATFYFTLAQPPRPSLTPT